MAVQAGSTLDPESFAWSLTRLGFYELQAGDLEKALAAVDAAVRVQSDYAPALLMRGRVLLATGQSKEALESLTRATSLNPLPDYQWLLAETLRETGRQEEGRLIELELEKNGVANDSRTFSLYLSTKRKNPQLSLSLAEQELNVRSDVFTHDAVAWALFAAGDAEKSRVHMQKALSEGTQDARLFYHAGLIAASLHKNTEACDWFAKAVHIEQTLFPSERQQLHVAIIEMEKQVSKASLWNSNRSRPSSS
jgi:tetratricopeptide (TPR) repeat protein